MYFFEVRVRLWVGLNRRRGRILEYSILGDSINRIRGEMGYGVFKD